MSVTTEAACLLETGALYGRRLLLRPATGDPIFAGFKYGAFSLYFGDAPIFHFDLEGRWQRAFVDGVHYLKSLDNRVQTIDRVREGSNLVLRRKTFSSPEVHEFDARVRAVAIDLRDSVLRGQYTTVMPPSGARPVSLDELRAFLDIITHWDAAGWEDFGVRYRETYGPPPFLPPDCLNPLLLQATHDGESAVVFGGKPGQAQSFARTPGEFDRHARNVASLLGRRVEQCKSVFLGGHSVLRRPEGDVADYLEVVARVFPLETRGAERRFSPSENSHHRLAGVHAFLDRFDPPLPSPSGWRQFRELGLTRVTLGVESGDAGARGRGGKTWGDEGLRETFSNLKSAGIGVGLVIPATPGSTHDRDRHVSATVSLINTLDLGMGDVVSILDSDLSGGVAECLEDFKKGLAPLKAAKKIKVVTYNPDKQGRT